MYYITEQYLVTSALQFKKTVLYEQYLSLLNRLYRGERMGLKIFSETGQTTSMASETYQGSSG